MLQYVPQRKCFLKSLDIGGLGKGGEGWRNICPWGVHFSESCEEDECQGIQGSVRKWGNGGMCH